MTVKDNGGQSTTITGIATIADAPLTPGIVTVNSGVEGVTATTLTATFGDANNGASTSDFSGTINWGDGTTTNLTSGAVTGSNGSYTVSGSHTYRKTAPTR